MLQTIAKLTAALLLPPLNLLVLGGFAWTLARRSPRIGMSLLACALAGLYVLSAPIVTSNLIRMIEPMPQTALAPLQQRAQAIVVLGGGTYFNAPEYVHDTVGTATLERLRWAARLHRATGLPVLVSGGTPLGNAYSEAEQMRDSLLEDFHVPVQWIETRAANTYQSASYTRDLLRPDSISRIALVTHAAHMHRATLVFERAGFKVVPAPTGFTTRGPSSFLDFLPSATGLTMGRFFFHELIGIGWYHLRIAYSGPVGSTG